MRTDYISWDTYFMGVAILSSKRSKDPRTQVGACIVNKNLRIVGIGYNGFPRGCSDTEFPWEKEGNFLDTKYPYVVHAEVNAILNSLENLTGSKLYVTLFPCCECAKQVIQAGIEEVIYMDAKYDTDSYEAALRMFKAANIKIRKMEKFDITI